MPVTSIFSRPLVVLFLVLGLNTQAYGQNFTACQEMTFSSSLPLKNEDFFIDTNNLDKFQELIKKSMEILQEFQTKRAQRIRQQTAIFLEGDTASEKFLSDFSEFNSQFRVAMALGFRNEFGVDPIYSDLIPMINKNLDVSQFRAIPIKNLQPLDIDELENALSSLHRLLSLELRIFEKQLQRIVGKDNPFHPHKKLLQNLQNAATLGEKLAIQSDFLQIFIKDVIARFRKQQREMAMSTMIHSPPLAYTSAKSEVTFADYKMAIENVIKNGDNEVVVFQNSLLGWTDENEFNKLKEQVHKRHGTHKVVTIANAIRKLDNFFDYIPAIEEALIESRQLCEVAERGLALHFKKLENQQIGSLVLFAGAIAVAPMLTGPLALTVLGAGGFSYSIYSINQSTKEYRDLVDQALTEIYSDDINPQFYEDLKEQEINLLIQSTMLPTLFPILGFGVRGLTPLAKSAFVR